MFGSGLTRKVKEPTNLVFFDEKCGNNLEIMPIQLVHNGLCYTQVGIT